MGDNFRTRHYLSASIDNKSSHYDFPGDLYLWLHRQPSNAYQPSDAETGGEEDGQHLHLQPDDSGPGRHVRYGHPPVLVCFRILPHEEDGRSKVLMIQYEACEKTRQMLCLVPA